MSVMLTTRQLAMTSMEPAPIDEMKLTGKNSRAAYATMSVTPLSTTV